MKLFTDIVKYTEMELKEYLVEELKAVGYDPIVGDGYLYARGSNCPVLLTAHLDTVHKQPVKNIVAVGKSLTSPEGIGGDDRCGVHIITTIINETDLRPWILFCEQEETGGKGARKFVNTEYIQELEEMKFLVEIDRHGSKDAVFYSCDNPEFTEFILDATGFKEEFGSFSDICTLSPECKVASVNLSCGYYNEHTTLESVSLPDMENTTDVVEKLLELACYKGIPQYEYIEELYSYSFSKYNYWWKEEQEIGNVYLLAYDNDGNEIDDLIETNSIDEAVGIFLRDNPTLCFNNIVHWSFM